MMPKPVPKVKIRIEFTATQLAYFVSMPITRAQRLKAADHLRYIAGDLERPWRKGAPRAGNILRARGSRL
jgi:hypothetical protein